MKKNYTLSVFTEDVVGMLSRITLIFTRRHVNIVSITASECELQGIYRYTIVVNVEEEMAVKLMNQIAKQVEVLKVFFHEETEVVSRGLSLYKIASTALENETRFNEVVHRHYARIINVTPQYIVVEKSGTAVENQLLFEDLSTFGILEYNRSGNVVVTKPMKTLSEHLNSN